MLATVKEIFIKSIFADSCVTDQEFNYSHCANVPLLDIIATTVNNLKFHCDKYRPQSVDRDLLRSRIYSQHYKFDGCISTSIDDTCIELVVLKVPDLYKIDGQTRFVEDHVKADDGLVTVLNEIEYLELHLESLCVELIPNSTAMLQQTLLTAIDNLRQSHIVTQGIYNRAQRQSPDSVPTLYTDILRINPQVKLDKDYLPAYDELAIDSPLF